MQSRRARAERGEEGQSRKRRCVPYVPHPCRDPGPTSTAVVGVGVGVLVGAVIGVDVELPLLSPPKALKVLVKS